MYIYICNIFRFLRFIYIERGCVCTRIHTFTYIYIGFRGFSDGSFSRLLYIYIYNHIYIYIFRGLYIHVEESCLYVYRYIYIYIYV